jgi:hypothetical protein
MKTKIFLLLCLFLGIGLTQLSAQNGKNGNGSVPEFMEWDGYYIDVPVTCGGTKVDRLVGLVAIHVVRQYKLGVFMGEIAWYDGEVTNARTGEVFDVKDHWKFDIATPDSGSGHFNIKGSLGSHYIISYIIDFTTDSFTFTKAVCN